MCITNASIVMIVICRLPLHKYITYHYSRDTQVILYCPLNTPHGCISTERGLNNPRNTMRIVKFRNGCN